MTVRYLAQELYHWTKRVEELEKALAGSAALDPEARAGLEAELRQARQEMEHYRTVLAAKKEKTIV
jgi:hypothetical protein